MHERQTYLQKFFWKKISSYPIHTYTNIQYMCVSDLCVHALYNTAFKFINIDMHIYFIISTMIIHRESSKEQIIWLRLNINWSSILQTILTDFLFLSFFERDGKIEKYIIFINFSILHEPLTITFLLTQNLTDFFSSWKEISASGNFWKSSSLKFHDLRTGNTLLKTGRFFSY